MVLQCFLVVTVDANGVRIYVNLEFESLHKNFYNCKHIQYLTGPKRPELIC